MARSKSTIERDRKILADYELESVPGATQYEVFMKLAKRHRVSYITVWRAIKRAKEAQV